MNDYHDLPMPADAPPPGSCVRVERPEPGLAVVVLDPPHRKLCVLDAPLLRDLDRAVGELERDGSLQGVVLTGRSAGEFAAGADVKAIEGLTDPRAVERMVRVVHALFLRIEDLRPRTVAAVGGAVPGGALELSLACDLIVATDDPKTRIGLPETQLGILPGWGGSHRLPKRIGLPKALEAILTGRLYPAKQAWKLAIVDRLTKPEYLRRVASDIAMGRLPCRRASRGVRAWLVDRNPLVRALIARQARKATLAKTKGHYPAPLAALELVVRAPGVHNRDAAEREANAVAGLATGPVCKSLIRIFFGMEEAKKLGRGRDGVEPRTIERAGVLGAGVMGGAIASMMAARGIATRLMDLAPQALDRAQLDHRAEIDKQRKRRRLEPHEATAALDRLEVTTEPVGFARTQLVVEAVAEKLEVKRQVLGAIARQAGPDAILATNTSSLSVGAIAEGLPHPERVCGMHFFNPVRQMPLVEVVRGERTSEQVVTTVAALALRLGKTPVVVADVAGFLVNRILGPYLDEALRLFEGGADVARVDRALCAFGMPMGPFALLDEVGFDIAQHAAASLHAAYGERMAPSRGLDGLVGPQRLGRKTGLGFYRHAEDRRRKPVVADDLAAHQRGTFARPLGDDEIVDRLVLAMANEAARCLDEGVVAGPRELDLATVLGTGFAPFRGGLLHWADTLGLLRVLDRLERIASAPDVAARGEGRQRFAPCALLRGLMRDGGTFHGARANAPTSAREPLPVE
jgi:3-hydroxyacyl-CoA dehydrogenase/enoyl-CoA hydratase/3-hydroxybutyryl-CoA epimerase